jgi:lipid II:glycine glycyltransferase (peptidoglycan interpeptide bridge formation enzyme)
MYFVKEVSYSDWCIFFKKCQKTNMLQCWEYGEAKEKCSRWKAARFFILNDKKETVALVQALVVSIPFIGGIVRVNRGPILLDNSSTSENNVEIFEIISALLKEFQRKHWWVVQIAPEVNKTDFGAVRLMDLGLRKLKLPPYASGLINLSVEESNLLSNLKKKWRYYLKKGQKISVKIDSLQGNSAQIEVLLNKYKKLQEDKEFSGLSSSLISELASQSSAEWEFSLFEANENDHKKNDDPLGMLVSIRHGDTATYLIGLTNNKGRSFQVNYVLLWEAILHSKQAGCTWFDIGGLDSTTPKGIRHFKSGVGSELYDLIGEWRGVLYPWKQL